MPSILPPSRGQQRSGTTNKTDSSQKASRPNDVLQNPNRIGRVSQNRSSIGNERFNEQREREREKKQEKEMKKRDGQTDRQRERQKMTLARMEGFNRSVVNILPFAFLKDFPIQFSHTHIPIFFCSKKRITEKNKKNRKKIQLETKLRMSQGVRERNRMSSTEF